MVSLANQIEIMMEIKEYKDKGGVNIILNGLNFTYHYMSFYIILHDPNHLPLSFSSFGFSVRSSAMISLNNVRIVLMIKCHTRKSKSALFNFPMFVSLIEII